MNTHYHLVITHFYMKMLWKTEENWDSNTGSDITLLCSIRPVFLVAKDRQPVLATLKVKMIMYMTALRKALSKA